MNEYRSYDAEIQERRRRAGPSDEVRLVNAFAEAESMRQKADKRLELAAADAERRVSRSASEKELHARVVRLAEQADESFRVAAIRHLKSTHGSSQADYGVIQRKLSKLLNVHEELTGEKAGWREI